MYTYTPFDLAFVQQRAQQYQDQLQRYLAGKLSDDEFRPLRLQNGWYVQRHAPMLRVAIPYGELRSEQLRVLAKIAREFDRDYGHFTTRQNIQYNWIPLEKSADVMLLLASVGMHGIQTSGNCIRNITSDERAGIAVDEIVDPRPFCEIIRQWSTLHPEFAFLPRKFKIAVTGAQEDRAAVAWHDVGLHVRRNEAGEVGFRVLAGGGMGRTPIVATTIREFLPWAEILNYLEALVRTYNRYGRRDNMYKARIKILVKAEGHKFIDDVEAEYRQIVSQDGAPHTLTQAELDRVQACFMPLRSDLALRPIPPVAAEEEKAFQKWLSRNVASHQNPQLRAVTLPLKRLGIAPGDASADVLDALATLADDFSAGQARVTHDQNVLLPWVDQADLPALWQTAKKLGLANATVGLLTDMITCPGGDFCALANARSLPVAEAITARYQDLDELHDLGPIDLHISGCINSCGHHHTGHIGILGVDKDGQEWYQVLLGGSDGSRLSGTPGAAKVVGPSFSAMEVPEVIEAVLDAFAAQRQDQETFIQTLRRVGFEHFKIAANSVRVQTAKA
jgi:sulfite reductase (NADPH) hemoprotein beta-component